ncbi:Glycosyltransferase Family 2 protein [Glomus cerebriforme]|uniref:chitin synthase n=1 Tax=Glomus cerebriforme TaxID=658196 RepID=A0A397SDQ1_9GLOM|nr:Glycosyltransferase Family 2 protein [Glomus cerebriforme]
MSSKASYQPSSTNRDIIRANIGRSKTLNRPERYHPTTPLLTGKTQEKKTVWVIFSRIVTFWAHPALLSSIGGLHDKQSRQAWREKISLCFIALIMSSVVGFLTVGFSSIICPDSDENNIYLRFNQAPGHLGILGWQFNVLNATVPQELPIFEILKSGNGQDITNYFTRKSQDTKSCVRRDLPNFAIVNHDPCPSPNDDFCVLNVSINDESLNALNVQNETKLVGYDWDQLLPLKNYIVVDGNVLNLDPYIASYPDPIDDLMDKVIRKVLSSGGKDATRLFFSKPYTKPAVDCIVDKYFAGKIDKQTVGCVTSIIFINMSLTVILGIVITRFIMACVFSWFISPRLALIPAKISKIHPTNASIMDKIGNNLFSVLLVTCYSEGEVGIRTTCESIAATDYPDDRKLLFLICDGIITGSGNSKSTPEICIKLMELSPDFKDPQPMSYIAVAAGAKQNNMAKVYVGHFRYKNKRIPMITVVKCGNNKEQNQPKPGNRGKRDSQLILMNFFSRVTYNDRMSALDFDLFRKITHLMGVTPDFFEVVLMVDADTKIYPDSLRLLVNCMCNDPLIMGLCGETRIANKRDSWVTSIQVFEYYISHHLGKAFESVFGGVTCLPGCFCMYRLKARKDNEWIPILTKPEIVQEYSQNIVDTLHQKNLLLLGEDRFLTTLMLRNFPYRKMIFCPQAICKTVVPDKFNVLLSQRRRWVNSTIHNLMELVLVRNLCGTFCFSMQFVILMELIGTVVLPISILLTYSLIISAFMQPPKDIFEALPLLMLVTILGLPAIIILLTTRKIVYTFWMVIYLLSLPVWNFILPMYAYWHFDDFSWGETRKVEGEDNDNHGEKDGLFDSSKVTFKRWEDWERARLRKMRRQKQFNIPIYPGQQYNPHSFTTKTTSNNQITQQQYYKREYDPRFENSADAQRFYYQNNYQDQQNQRY